MSWDVENTKEEIEELKGCTIVSAKIKPSEFEGEGRSIELKLRFPHPLTDGETMRTYREGIFQVWQDEEGNGPGYIALVGFASEVKRKAAKAA